MSPSSCPKTMSCFLQFKCNFSLSGEQAKEKKVDSNLFDKDNKVTGNQPTIKLSFISIGLFNTFN